MKTYSIKRRMSFILAGFVLFVLITSCMYLFAQTRGHFQLNKVYSLFKAYNAYAKTAELLQESIIQCFAAPSESNIEYMLTLAEELDTTGNKMFEFAGNQARQFQDTCQLTNQYTKEIRSFAESCRNSPEQIQTHVDALLHFHDLAMLQYATLETHITDVVDNNIHYNAILWKTLLTITLCMSLAMLAYTIIGSIKLGQIIVKPIMQLTQKLTAFKNDQHPISTETSSACEEFLILNDAYQDMAQTIAMQIDALQDKIEISETLRKKQEALSAAEMGLMQSLINPHFLYNSLSVLSSMAMIEHAPQTRQSALLIASFLRMSLDRIGKIITIQEELICTQKYLDIQKLRFSDMIQYTVACEAACMPALVPAMLIQPLVENAIQHGVKNMATEGKIDIQIKKQARFIHLSVIDNGIGISPERQEEIKKMLLDDFDPEQKGVGLRSVAYRMRNIFDSGMKFEIESRPGRTEFCLIFPFRLMNEQQ